eukprot:5416180-Prymnesium_polylepis.2
MGLNGKRLARPDIAHRGCCGVVPTSAVSRSACVRVAAGRAASMADGGVASRRPPCERLVARAWLQTERQRT